MTAVLREKGIIPEVAAGLSLGEYSALQAAGGVRLQDGGGAGGFPGKAMAQAVQDRPCGMAAVLMLGREQLAECCRQAGEAGVVEIANYNCPTQLVIAGDAAAVEKAGGAGPPGGGQAGGAAEGERPLPHLP